MTNREFLALRSAELLNSETAFLDASILLAHCMGLPREKLLTCLPERIDSGVAEAFSGLWKRRMAGESIAYILGKKEFYGRDFVVDRRVLVPRPDTETLVAAALEVGDAAFALKEGKGSSLPSFRLHDVCTGSGAVAVSLAAERPGWLVSASDISPEALDVARINASLLSGKEIRLTIADLLCGIEGPFEIITANPPYVPSLEADQLLGLGWGNPDLPWTGERTDSILSDAWPGRLFQDWFRVGFF